MKCAEYTFDDTIIAFYNSNWGKETVTVNGKVVSEKSSVLGTRHEFSVDNDNYELITSFVISRTIGIESELRKNGKFIDKQVSGQQTKNILIGILIMFGIFKLLEIIFHIHIL